MTAKSKWVLILALVLGLFFVVIMVKLKEPPQRLDVKVIATPVRVLHVVPQVVQVEAFGYGQVLPTRSWKAVASIAGRVIWKSPNLTSGHLISAGTPLLKIDPARYQLARSAAAADLDGLEAELRQLVEEQRNTQALLALEQRRLALVQRELERAQILAKRDALSVTRLDEQQRITLQQEQAVQRLNHQLNLVPVRRDALLAQKERAKTNLDRALRDLEDTEFEAPWALRVHQADIEVGQYISPGQILLIADDISQAEATIQVELAELRRVFTQLPQHLESPSEALASQGFVNFHHQLALDQLQIDVYPTNAPDVHWRGQLNRITSSLAASTRTLQAVIRIDEPYRNAQPPARPPLVRNMFVQARISALTPEPVVVIPASALHQNHVYLVNIDGRLQRRKVVVAWRQGEQAVIAEGLAAGDRLILDDLVPAIDGTPLAIQVVPPGASL